MQNRNQQNKPSFLLMVLALVFVLFFFNTNETASEVAFPSEPTQIVETTAPTEAEATSEPTESAQ